MSHHALAIHREDNTLALFLRLVRAPSGIYVVYGAGQRRRHDPHTSWHRGGRYHQKSFDHASWIRKRQPLDASFTGAEPFITTGVTRDATGGLPDCQPNDFDSVIKIPGGIVRDAPAGTQVDVQLVGRDAEPIAPMVPHRLHQHATIAEADGMPSIWIHVYDAIL